MKTLTVYLIAFSIMLPAAVLAQVDEIKKASANHHDGDNHDSGSVGNSTAFMFVGMLDDAVLAVAAWQSLKLEKKAVNPTVVSFDVMLQGAVQPSSYYILDPRIRANWGLFSTDFRFNYLIEEGLDGTKHIRTSDWQILQLNIVTTKNFIGRVGGGILREAFNDKKQFPEWTAGVHFRSTAGALGAMTEYRWAEVRHEWNGQIQYRLFHVKSLNTYLTAGVVYQRYYRTIDVWGMQGGVMFRFY